MGVTALAAVCGAGAGLGLLLIILGLRGQVPRYRRRQWLLAARWERPVLRAGLATGSGALAAVATGWPVGALLAAAAGAALPGLLAGGRAAQRASIERTEAVAAWAEMLRGTLAGAAGLEEAIIATAPAAPPAIRSELQRLAVRLRHERLAPALRALAGDLDDPTADLVIAALLLAAEQQGGQLGEALAAVARAARDQASMQLRVEAGRARTRTSVRVITGTTLAMLAGLLALNRGFLEPYGTAPGQLVLAVIGGLFAAAFWWLARLARPRRPERILAVPSREVPQ